MLSDKMLKDGKLSVPDHHLEGFGQVRSVNREFSCGRPQANRIQSFQSFAGMSGVGDRSDQVRENSRNVVFGGVVCAPAVLWLRTQEGAELLMWDKDHSLDDLSEIYNIYRAQEHTYRNSVPVLRSPSLDGEQRAHIRIMIQDGVHARLTSFPV